MATTATDGNKNQSMLKVPEGGPPSQADYAQWAAAMQQAYYNGGGPQFFPNASSTPSPHPFPFGWGTQYPYGGPSPYPPLTMFPPPGVAGQQTAGAPPYSHVPPASSLGPDSTTLRPKPVVRGGAGEDAKASGTPTKRRGDPAADVKEENANGDFPASFKEANGNGDSAQDKDDRHMSGLTMLRKRSYEHMSEAGLLPNGPEAPTPGAFAAPATAFNPSGTAGATQNGGNGTQTPESWLQDEREVKRQRRKQSNRESARRSRLRKQAECEELGTRVDGLQLDNCQLKNELTNVTELLKQISEEHKRLVEEFTRATGKRATTTVDMDMVKKVLSRASELVQQQSVSRPTTTCVELRRS